MALRGVKIIKNGKPDFGLLVPYQLELGKYAMLFNEAEHYLKELILNKFGMYHVVLRIMWDGINMSEILRGYEKARNEGLFQDDKLKEFAEEFSNISAERNRFLHGLWSIGISAPPIGEEGKVWAGVHFKKSTRTKYQKSPKAFELKELRQANARLEKFCSKVLARWGNELKEGLKDVS